MMESARTLVIHLIVFISSGLFVKIIHVFMTRYIEKTRFSSMIPHRKAYVVKNITKSIILAFITLPAVWIGFQLLFNHWNNMVIISLGTVYAVGDIIALFSMFNKLPLSTKLHHITVLALETASVLCTDYRTFTVMRGFVVYALLSCPTFLVNLCLAMRHLMEKGDARLVLLMRIALVNYTICLTINWIYQIYFLHKLGTLTRIVYILVVTSLVNDDIVLVKFLWNRGEPRKNLLFSLSVE